MIMARYTVRQEPATVSSPECVEEPQFDFVMLSCVKDYVRAKNLIEDIQHNLDITNRYKVKAAMFDDRISLPTPVNQCTILSALNDRANFLFIYISENFMRDAKKELSQEKRIVESFRDPANINRIVPLFSDESFQDGRNLPFDLGSVIPLRKSNHFYEDIFNILTGEKAILRKQERIKGASLKKSPEKPTVHQRWRNSFWLRTISLVIGKGAQVQFTENKQSFRNDEITSIAYVPMDIEENRTGTTKSMQSIQSGTQSNPTCQKQFCIMGKNTSYLEKARRALQRVAFIRGLSHEIKIAQISAFSVSEEDLHGAPLVILLGIPEPRGIYLSSDETCQLGRAYTVALKAKREVMLILVIESRDKLRDNQVTHDSFRDTLCSQPELLKLYYESRVMTVVLDQSRELTLTQAQEKLLENWVKRVMSTIGLKVARECSWKMRLMLHPRRKLIIHLRRNTLREKINLKSSGLLDVLQEKNVLTDLEARKIGSLLESVNQVDMLLDYIEQKANEEFDLFRSALTDSINEDLLSPAVIDDTVAALQVKLQRYIKEVLNTFDRNQIETLNNTNMYVYQSKDKGEIKLFHYTTLFEAKRVCVKEEQSCICNQKILYDWALATACADNMENSIEVLRQFKLVLPITLCLVKPGITLLKELQDQLNFLSIEDLSVIEWLLKYEEEKILLLFDRLDDNFEGEFSEVVKIMNGSSYKECFVVITSGEEGLHLLRKLDVNIPIVETKLEKISANNSKGHEMEVDL